MSSSARSAAIPALNGRSDAKRDAILRGAKAVFLKHGFESTSMDVVALRAGVSKMTVYRHFGSKEALFAGVITDLCERIVDGDLRKIFELPPREALMTFARKMIAIVFAHETIELHRIVIAESRRFPKLGRRFYQSGPEACIAALATYFSRHVDDARFKVRNPRRAAEEFLELLRGYAHLRVMLGLERTPSSEEMEERIEGAIRHVLN
jgi:TetR/AcrR family transcriptional regulator, mexJK operon transcriptional repressor